MPTNVKIYFQGATDNPAVRWVALGLGIFMAVSLWIFPEPKNKKPLPKNDRS